MLVSTIRLSHRAKSTPVIADAISAMTIAQGVVSDYLAMIVARAEERFSSNGGCDRCRGRGWVVVWDTLDSTTGCYAEYGRCPIEGCTSESRAASGLKPKNTKHDKFKSRSTWDHASELSPAEIDWLQMLRDMADTAEADFRTVSLAWIESQKPSKGARVRIKPGAAKGKLMSTKKRAKAGTEGTVFFTKNLSMDASVSGFNGGTYATGDGWHGRVGFGIGAVDSNGRYADQVWIDARHLEVITDEEEKTAAK